jgi:GntR family transcriptional regulator
MHIQNSDSPDLGYISPRMQPTRIVPLYHQIKEDLTLQIRSGRWRTDQEIPSETALCKRYNVSRGTIRRAIGDLVQQGLIYRKQGRGSFVSKPKLEGGVLGSYRLYLKETSLDAGSRVLHCQRKETSGEILRLLGVTDQAEVYELERIRFVKGIPISLQISYLPADLCPNLEHKDLSRETLYEVIQREYNFMFLRAEESLEPVLADDYVAEHLNIPVGSPVFLVERLSYTFNDRIGEVRRAHVRGDLYRYRIVLQ